MELPDSIKKALDIIDSAGYECWLVGGCVRDAVMGIKPHDYDITVSSTPEETMAVFDGCRIIETGLKHGTVTVLIDGEPIEITTYRVEGEYLDNRHPSEVSFTRCIEDDLKRRDFTINAIAYHPDRGLLDLFGGVRDIENKTIRCVGNSVERFEEDGLRILRALRFASRLGFSLDDETEQAIFLRAGLLSSISAERIYSELCGILCGSQAGSIIQEYAAVFSVFIPEMREIIDFPQNSKYHCFDVLGHTCKAIDSSVPDILVRLSLLLHDIGKPRACFRGSDGYDHFFGHEEISAEMADTILKRLRADGHTRRTVVKLIGMHDRAVVPNRRNARRFLRELSYEEAMLLMEIKLGDMLAHAEGFRDTAGIMEMKSLITDIHAQSGCFSLSSLAVKGDDLISLGMEPGKNIGIILNRLLDMVINEEIENESDALLKKAVSIAEEIK